MADLSEELHRFNPWWERSFEPAIIARPHYAEFLKQNTMNRDIVVITGLRRVGKTSVMKGHVASLLIDLAPKYIFYASLDSLALERFALRDLVREYRRIHALRIEERVYLFLDEVAYRKDIHQELKNLYDSENAKIFASASSASILRDTHAMLTGRSRIMEVLPLDFRNTWLSGGSKRCDPRPISWNAISRNICKRGHAGARSYGDVSYLDSLLEGVIFKDIMAVHGVRDVTSLRDFFRLLMERAGKQFTINKASRVIGVSVDTVRRYLEYFTQAYLVYTIERCGKLNERLRAPKKLYAADLGLRNLVTGFRDKGAILENLVFLKIKDAKPCYVYQGGSSWIFSLPTRSLKSSTEGICRRSNARFSRPSGKEEDYRHDHGGFPGLGGELMSLTSSPCGKRRPGTHPPAGEVEPLGRLLNQLPDPLPGSSSSSAEIHFTACLMFSP